MAEHKTLGSYQNEAVLIAPMELFSTLCKNAHHHLYSHLRKTFKHRKHLQDRTMMSCSALTQQQFHHPLVTEL